jgi:hypothetical protein
MKREDIEKLLGGYATGSLTPSEREALFTAALDDQALFDQLAREEVLRQALDDPAARAGLLTALDERPASWPRRLTAWLGRPAGLAGLAAATAAILTLGVYFAVRPDRPQPSIVAQMRPEEKTPKLAAPAAPPVADSSAPVKDEQPPRANRRKEAPEQLAESSPQGAVGVVGGVPGGVAGGVPGGVIGGIIGTPQSVPRTFSLPPPPPPPARAAAPRSEAVTLEAPAQAPAPPVVEKSARADKAPEASEARALFNLAPGDPALRKEEGKGAAAAPAASGLGGAVGAVRRRAAKARQAEVRQAVAQPAAAHLGLRYTVLRRGPSGPFAETDPGTAFARGDQLRLSFEPNDTGYLYVLQREAGGGWRLIASDRVERHASYQAPRDGSLVYEQPGAKQVYAIFSRTPDPAIAALDPGAIEARLRAALPAQKSESGAASGQQAVYVVDATAVPQSQQIALTITLTVR